jgi:hypothetical protein
VFSSIYFGNAVAPGHVELAGCTRNPVTLNPRYPRLTTWPGPLPARAEARPELEELSLPVATRTPGANRDWPATTTL